MSGTPEMPQGPYPSHPYGNSTTPDPYRTDLPGIFLIVVGVLNILGSFYFTVQAVLISLQPEADYIQQQQEAIRVLAAYFKTAPQNIQPPSQGVALGINLGLGLVQMAAGAVTLAAGVRMRQLRNYGLSVLGAFLAILPCISCSGCCGLGEIVGIWAMIVLLTPEVRAAFRLAGYGPGAPVHPYGQYPPPGPGGWGSPPPGAPGGWGTPPPQGPPPSPGNQEPPEWRPPGEERP